MNYARYHAFPNERHVTQKRVEPCFQVKDFYDLPDGVDHPKPSQVGFFVHHFQGLGSGFWV
jgi:hypothetical protein